MNQRFNCQLKHNHFEIDSHVYNRQLETKSYLVVGYGGGRGTAGFLNLEFGSIAVIDPATAKIYLYEYGGGGVGLGVGAIAGVKIGIMDMTRPTDIKGLGFDVSGFLAGGDGMFGEIDGNGIFANGNNQTLGGHVGYGFGGGFSISGDISYTFNEKKVTLDALPKSVLQAILAYKSIVKYPHVMGQTKQALARK